MGKIELIALLNLSSWCLVMVERLFLAMPRGCLQFVIVVFPDHTHLLFFCCCWWSIVLCTSLFVGVLCLLLFCKALLCVRSSFAIILKRERKLVAFQSYSLTILEIRKVTDGLIYTEPKL